MTVTIDLPKDMEEVLRTQALARGLSVEQWLLQLAERAVEQPAAEERFKNLSDLLLHSPFAGANLDLERLQGYPRPHDLE